MENKSVFSDQKVFNSTWLLERKKKPLNVTLSWASLLHNVILDSVHDCMNLCRLITNMVYKKREHLSSRMNITRLFVFQINDIWCSILITISILCFRLITCLTASSLARPLASVRRWRDGCVKKQRSGWNFKAFQRFTKGTQDTLFSNGLFSDKIIYLPFTYCTSVRHK